MSKDEDFLNEDRIYDLVATGSALLAGALVKKALEAGWKTAKHEDPPKNPAANDVSWKDAIIWTLATGVVVGLTKLLVKKGTAEHWKKKKND